MDHTRLPPRSRADAESTLGAEQRPGAARTAARGVGRATKATAVGVGRGAGATGRLIRRSTRAEGAGESGLASLIDVQAIHSAADSLLTIALASTLFFAVPVGEARGKVALYLLVTMAPFALVAPVIGPLLDRLRHGRRYAIATTLLGRGLLAWVIAGAVGSKTGFELYPAAFGVLVLSKAYGVSRSSVVPRVLPEGVGLVRANARLTLFGVLAATVAAPVAAGLAKVTGSPSWPLRLAALVYFTGIVFALRLPKKVDSNAGEAKLERPRDTVVLDLDELRAGASPEEAIVQPSLWRRILPPLRGVGPLVGPMIRMNVALRCFSGFLTLFFAFLVRSPSFHGASVAVGLGVLIAGASIGSIIGTVIGTRLRALKPETIALSSITLVAAACTLAAVRYSIFTIAVVAMAAGIAQSTAKLALDSVLQRDVAEEVRTSAFARSETMLQLAWVAGGAIGLIPFTRGDLGLGLAAIGLLGALAISVQSVRNQRAAARHQTTEIVRTS